MPIPHLGCSCPGCCLWCHPGAAPSPRSEFVVNTAVPTGGPIPCSCLLSLPCCVRQRSLLQHLNCSHIHPSPPLAHMHVTRSLFEWTVSRSHQSPFCIRLFHFAQPRPCETLNCSDALHLKLTVACRQLFLCKAAAVTSKSSRLMVVTESRCHDVMHRGDRGKASKLNAGRCNATLKCRQGVRELGQGVASTQARRTPYVKVSLLLTVMGLSSLTMHSFSPVRRCS